MLKSTRIGATNDIKNGYDSTKSSSPGNNYSYLYSHKPHTVQFNDKVPEEASVFYVGDDLPFEDIEKDNSIIIPNSIFLAGPTPRHTFVSGGCGSRVRIPTNNSWRPRAIRKLYEMDFDGHIFVPETSDWDSLGDYNRQIWWEWAALGAAACVVFWVPRQLDLMPALTTNVEFGFVMALKPENMVLGYPKTADKTRYLKALSEDQDMFCDAFGLEETREIPVCNSMTHTLEIAKDIAENEF